MNTNTKRSIAKALLDIGAVGFSPRTPIAFKSGIISPVYVDNRRLIYHPQQWHIIIDGFASAIRDLSLNFDIVAGVAVGGLPHSSALAYIARKPAVFVRKESKGHGTAQRIEGGEVSSKRVLLLEDLVTTGGSSLSAVAALRAGGAIVADVIAIVSYGFPQATTAFAAAATNLHTLTDFKTILELAAGRELYSADDAEVIHAWFRDPHAWAPSNS